jgi:phosphoglycolate phosphatase-like HAD superfamily hydrolase
VNVVGIEQQHPGFFDAVVTRNYREEMKPNAVQVRQTLIKMHVMSEGAILVGDAVMDIVAAKAVGLPSVAGATGPFASEVYAKQDTIPCGVRRRPTDSSKS